VAGWLYRDVYPYADSHPPNTKCARQRVTTVYWVFCIAASVSVTFVGLTNAAHPDLIN